MKHYKYLKILTKIKNNSLKLVLKIIKIFNIKIMKDIPKSFTTSKYTNFYKKFSDLMIYNYDQSINN